MFGHLGTSEHAERHTLAADEICYWDAPASELGFTGAAASGPAAPASETAAADPGSDTDAHAAADQDASDTTEDVERPDAAEEDDPNADPLDALARDEESDEDAPATRTIEDRYKGLKQRARKLERAYKKHLPTIQALREAGVDLRTLIQRSQKLADFERNLESNPRVRSLLYGEDEPNTDRRDSRSDRGRGRAEEDTVSYPFDTNDEVGRFLADFHKSTRTQSTDIVSRLERIEQSLGQRVDRIEQSTRQREVTAMQTEWRSATQAAAGKLPEEYRPMFNDAVYGAMEQVASGRLRATPQQIIDHYLKRIKVSDGQKARASNAARQRIATRNDQLPRRPSGNANGSPASPRSRAIPRLEEFNRDISRRFGSV